MATTTRVCFLEPAEDVFATVRVFDSFRADDRTEVISNLKLAKIFMEFLPLNVDCLAAFFCHTRIPLHVQFKLVTDAHLNYE